MKVVKVGDIAEQVRGVTYSKDDAFDAPKAGAIALLRANNITDDGLDFSNLIWVGEGNVSSRQHLRRGDIVVAASSGSISVVGKAAQLDVDFVGTFGAFCKVLRPSTKVHDRYLGHFLRTPAYRRLISSLAAGANINNLKNEHLDNLDIPLPPLDEQRRIAAILDQADALRRKRQETSAHADQLTQSVFLKMFGDPIHNPLNFEMARLGSLVDQKRGISYGIVQRGEDLDSGVPVLRISDISDKLIAPNILKQTSEEISAKYRRTVLKGGEIVISIRGTVGRCCVVGESLRGANVSREIAVIPYKYSEFSDFLLSLIRTDSAQARLTRDVKGIAQSGINLEDLRELPVIQPPKELMLQFLALIRHFKLVQAKSNISGIHLDSLFASLQHRAFNGKL